MVTVVFVVGVLNLALGVSLALVAEQPWQLILPAWPRRRAPADTPVNFESENVGVAWRKSLRQAGIDADSVVESLLWVIHLELPGIRRNLRAVDRAMHAENAPELLDGQLRDINDEWIERLDLWAAIFRGEVATSPYEELATELQGQLLDAAFDAKQAGEALEAAAKATSLPTTEVLQQLARLYRTFDTLRDFVARRLSDMLRGGQKTESIPRTLLTETPSGILTRLGLEQLICQWCDDDEERLRIVSCVLIDVDRMCRINETVGTAAGDCIVNELGELLFDSIRQERGFDRLAKYSGATYLLFLGDTATKSAVSNAERIRQTIEVSSFQIGDQSIELTTSVGITELGRQTIEELLFKLGKCLSEAKKAGRNQTFAAKRRGPALETAPQYLVERREIKVDVGDVQAAETLVG